MRRKIALILMLCLCFVFLGGCGLFTLNQDKYLDLPIIRIETAEGDKLEINKRDLLTAYNNYGADLVQNYGYTTQKALESTIEVLINREVTLYEAKKLIELTNADYNKIWKDTYDAIISNISEYETELIKGWKLNIPAELGTEDAETGTPYEPYEQIAEISKINGSYVVTLKNSNSIAKTEDLKYAVGEEYSSIFEAVQSKLDSADNKDLVKEAQRRYIRSIEANDKKKYLSKTDREILEGEIERIWTNVEENLYIEKYTELNKGTDNVANITLKQVLSKLTSKLKSSYAKYSIDFSSYEYDILNSYSITNYVMDDNYFFVNHILLKYSDEQQAEINAWKEWYEQGGSYLVYQNALKNIADQILVKENDIETSITAGNFYLDLKSEMTGKSDEKKMEIFRDYLYKYNEDGGNVNAEYSYIVGTENSSMVENFTDVSRELYNNGKGKFGDIATAATEHGLHVVFYIGKVGNAFTIGNPNDFNLVNSDAEALESIVNKLTGTKLNAFNNKTLFDLIYEELATDNYSIFENLNLNVLKKDMKIERFPGNYKDLLG